MRVLIASDKWKGTWSAPQACAEISAAVTQRWPEAQCDLCPIADGGEGTVDALLTALGGERRTSHVSGPLGTVQAADWALLPGGTAVIEMAAAAGHASVPTHCRDPWRTTTSGVGQLILAATQAGAQDILLGLGGSATNDLGTGMAQALGWQFHGITQLPRDLAACLGVTPPESCPWPQVEALCDVTNPLLGPTGCTRIYGPQKGVVESDFPAWDAAHQRMASFFPPAYAQLPGAGAAGGMGFGVIAFAHGSLVPGFARLAELTGLAARIRAADLILTGEGSIDAQTLSGKGPHGIALLARQHGKPVIALGGRVESAALTAFDQALAITPSGMALDEAIRQAPALLRAAVARISRPKRGREQALGEADS
jgi:glycerate 2-kinase